MSVEKTNLRTKLAAAVAAGCLLLGPVGSFAAPADEPSAGEMTADMIVARPLGLVATVLGTATFVVSLPFSALGGNVGEAADALVVGPGKATFVRCLGCRTSGRYQGADE